MEWKKSKQNQDSVTIPDRWVFMHFYEAYNILFRIENALRVFIYMILRNKFKDKWVELYSLACPCFN